MSSQHSSAKARWWFAQTPAQRATLEKLANDKRVERLNAKLDQAAIVARLNKARAKRARKIAARRASLGMPPLSLV